MADQRLPTVNGDDGTWGDILNQYLSKEHYNTGSDNPANGGHQKITVRAGTATAGTAPLKFTSGTLLTSAEAGAMEFNNDSLYFTITTSAVRKTIAMYDDSSGATGDIYYRTSGGAFTRLAIGSTNDVLKVSGGLPAWGAASGGAPGGSNGDVQYNDGGVFGGGSSFNFNPSNNPNLFLIGEDDSYVTFQIKSRSMQTSNLQEWTDNSLNPLIAVTPTGNLDFGGDTTLYRSAANTLATNDDFNIKNGKGLLIDGSSSGVVTIKAAAAAGTYSLTLPTTDGNSNEVLKTDGSGVLSWGSSAQTYSEFLYDAGGVQAGNTYTSWSALITAAQGQGGYKRITFVGSQTIPSGTWNMTDITLSCNAVDTFSNPVTCATGCVFTNWNGRLENISLISNSSSYVVDNAGDQRLYMDNATLSAGGSAPFMRVAGFVTVFLGDYAAIVYVTQPTIRLISNDMVVYVIGSFNAIEDDTVDGTGNVYLYMAAIAYASNILPTFGALTGTVALALSAQSRWTGYDPAISGLTATNVQAAIDEVVASGSGGGMTWSVVTGTSQAAAVNNGYASNNASLVTITLPSTAAVGDTVAITGFGAGGWKLAQNASQVIYFGNVNTTTGTGGYLASSHRMDSISLVCVVANTSWKVINSTGSITYV